MTPSPATTWELHRLPDRPELAVWVWRNPPTAPWGVAIRVPTAVLQATGGWLTVRRLLPVLAADPRTLTGVIVHGALYPVIQGVSPVLDQPLSGAPGADIELLLQFGQVAPAAPMSPPPMILAPGWPAPTGAAYPTAATAFPAAAAPVPAQAPAPAVIPTSGSFDLSTHARYNAIETDWLAILQLEAQLGGLRKQLAALQGKLQSLNRDLSTDEARAADSQDKREWTDARRWLRDAAAQVSRVLRSFDIGMVSAAGNRNRFQDVFTQYIEPRRPLEGLASWQQQFESHRKTAQSLLNEMTSVLGSASRDGEQRAQQLLARIAAKVRNARTKK